MDFKEFSGKTLQDAITAACEEFIIPSDKIEYEVVTEGSSGFLGIGAKPAIIKARVKSEKKENKKDIKKESKKEKKSTKAEIKEEKKSNVEAKEETPVSETVKTEVKDENKPEKKKIPVNVDVDKVIAEAEKFLKDVFEAMKLDVKMKSEFSTADAELLVELSGPSMGVLIGKRGQTLDSLQYLTSLVINKGTAGYIRVKVDTEDYRRRRKATLENLAKNLSYKVKKTRKSVSLEPMNPYERRIIHSALQNDKFVSTHSEGDEPYRRVVITPKKVDRY